MTDARLGDWLLTYSGEIYWPLDPRPEEVHLEDIALATATVSGKVYAIGGRLNGDYRRNLSVAEVYDPITDRWALAADLPTARSGITAAEVGGRIYVFGGEGGDGTFRENEAYDPARDTWQTMAPMSTGCHGLGSAVVQGRIHVISGGPTPGGSFSNRTKSLYRRSL